MSPPFIFGSEVYSRKRIELSERYKVNGEIGRGGYSIVYDVTDTETQENFALKDIVPTQKALGRMKKRNIHIDDLFNNEFSVPKNVKHLIPTEKLVDYGRTYVKMPLYNIFFHEIIDKPLSIDQIIDFSLQIAYGLEEHYGLLHTLHGQMMNDIIEKYGCGDVLHYVFTGTSRFGFEYNFRAAHGDLKPRNIAFDNGTLRIGDRSNILSSPFLESPSFNNTGYYEYMAPELANEGSYPDQGTDIYSLGKILAEMLKNNCQQLWKDMHKEMPLFKDPAFDGFRRIMCTIIFGSTCTERIGRLHELGELIKFLEEAKNMIGTFDYFVESSKREFRHYFSHSIS